jgi:hypothetical protein
MKLMISSHQYLELDLSNLKIAESSTDYSNWCERITVTYIDDQTNTRISFHQQDIRVFCDFFTTSNNSEKLLNSTMKIHDIIKNDLGYECNEHFKGNTISYDIFDYHWMSNDHGQIRPYYNSWLYNDKDGNILLEITPFYPWHNVNKRTQPERIPYKEWIKSYKPIVKTIIPKENFKQWIAQVEKMKQEYNL